MNKNLVAFFEYLEREKGIKRNVIVSAIEESLVAAIHKSKETAHVSVQVNAKTGEIEVSTEKEVVEKVNYPEEEISFEEAQTLVPDCQIGDYICIVTSPEELSRIAVQTARQVMTQRLLGAERTVIFEEYRHRVKEIVSGPVKKIRKDGALIIDLGKVEAILPFRFYSRTEKYRIGDRVHALLHEVRDGDERAEVILSRTDPEFVIELFKNEVPELADGTIVIKKIVREAGYRTKIAVISEDPKVDAVGACVGVRGIRIKNVIRELHGEKIDIIPYSADIMILLANALSPIQIKKYKIDEEDNTISIVVDDDNYPAVLGKKGYNIRLIGSMVGKELDVRRLSDYQKELVVERREFSLSTDPSLDEPLTVEEGYNQFVIDTLHSAGFISKRNILAANPKEIAEAANITVETVEAISEKIRKERTKFIG